MIKSEKDLRNKLNGYKTRCVESITKIDTLSPLKTLTRGYSVVENKDGKLIKTTKDVKPEDIINITVTDGKISAIVK